MRTFDEIQLKYRRFYLDLAQRDDSQTLLALCQNQAQILIKLIWARFLNFQFTSERLIAFSQSAFNYNINLTVSQNW